MKRKNKNLAAVTMAATMACGAYARAGEVIGDWQSSSPLITNNPNNVGQTNGGTGQNDGWFDWQASQGGNGDTNTNDTITFNNPGSQPGTYFPPPYYTYQTTPAAAVSIGTQALQAEVYQSTYYQSLSLKTQFETDGEGNNEQADFFDNTEFTVQVTYNAEQWQSTAGIQNGLSINAGISLNNPANYGFNDQNTNYGNNGFGPPNYDTGNPTNPGNWDASDYASTATGGITTRTMTFYYGNLLPGGAGNPNSKGATTISASSTWVELIMATNTYSTNGTLGDIYFSDAQFTNTQVNTSWQAEQHPQGTSYNWGNDLNFAPFNEAAAAAGAPGNGMATGGMPCNAGDIVTFGNDIPTGITETIDLNANQDFQISVGTMIFDNVNSSYLIDQGTGGTLTLNGNLYSPSTNTTTVGDSAIVDSGGSHTISAPVTLATTTTVAITTGNAFTLSGIVSGTGGLNIGPLTLPNSEGAADGGGSVVLSGSNTYTGGTTLSSGVLVAADTVSSATASSTGTSTVTLNGGILASAPLVTSYILGNVVAGTGSHTIAPGGVGIVGSLTIGGLTSTNLTTLSFELGSGAGPEISNGSLLTLGSGTVSIGSGTSLVFPNGSSTTIGDDYRLIGGTIGGINLLNFSLPTAPAGEAYSLSTGVDNGYIDLVVAASGPANLTWNNHSGNFLWDNGSSANWNSGSANTTFSAGSVVTFNDNNPSSTAANYAVTLNATVAPASILVNNSNGNYTISGTGTIGGTGSLTKSGTGTLTLSTPNTYGGGTNVSAGKLLIAQAGTNATIVNSTTLTVGNTLTALPSGGALSISGSGIVQLADGVTNQTFVTPGAHSSVPTSNINLTSLSITGTGTLDIGNNRIIVDYTSGNDPIASIAAWIKAGYNDGDTPGAGPSIISSDIATDDTASGYSYGIGYADGADHVVAGLPSGEIEIMFTLLGDANLDGTVNGDDFSQFSSNLGGSPRAWDEGDFNYDGTVNGEDFAPFSHNQGQTDVLAASETGTLTGPLELSNGISSNLSLTNVPEPASAVLMVVAGLGTLRRRRRATH
jgi:autotransporter-associated beta strand protein